jgi:Peptidase family M28
VRKREARSCGPAYYSPAMEAARPRGPRRPPRRGTVDRPLNARLVRVSSLIIVPALLALLFSVSATGTLPRPPLEPLFDQDTAASLAGELTSQFPSRVPGTQGDVDAALWFRESISAFGLEVEEDVWTEDIPELGSVELRNVVAVVPGRSDRAVVLVAHRDNAGVTRSYGDNASGTAALIELARGFAPRGAAETPRPQRTLVLVSTDGGAYGGAGAARFAAKSPYAEAAFAAVVLDGIAGGGHPRIAIAGDEPRSPAPALVRTALTRVEEQTGTEPYLAGIPTQLVDLGMPFAYAEQGRLLASSIAAVTLTTEEGGEPALPVGDPAGGLSLDQLGDMGRATEVLVGSIDASLSAAFRTPDSIFLRDRVASGWTVRLTLLIAVVPFALGALDLLVRTRRRRLHLAPAVRALRTRIMFWLYAGLLLWLAGVAGILPTGAALPLPTYSSLVTDWPVAGLGLVVIALAIGWLVVRRRLAYSERTTAEERLAGYSVALAWLAVVAFVIGVVKPYALAFVLPSLYAWLWLPLRTRVWARAALFAAGLAGPLAGLVILSSQLDLGLVDTALYVLGLATVGYISVGSVLLALAWAAAAGQLGALAFGRYAPYAGGAEPPPAGLVRTALGSLLLRSRPGYARTR